MQCMKILNKIIEVVIVWNSKEANERLAMGWILLHGGVAHQDEEGFNAKPCFILGRKDNDRASLLAKENK